MDFRVLGPLEVVDEGRIVPVERRRARAVLAFLLIHANEAVSAERLIDEVWGPEPPKSAAASLQNYVSHLRKALGRDVLLTETGGYVLRVDPEGFDLARFERLLADARRSPPRDRAEKLRAALALWRGRPLEDLAFESFAQPEIRRLEELRLEAVEERIDAELACGEGADLVSELERLVDDHPLRERLRGLLMRALYAAGRQADALDAYRDARRVLRDELGLDPGADLRELEQAILRQDPSLGGSAAEAADTRPDSRRTVSILFCDLVGSTRLAHQLDAEAYRALMTRYLDAVRGPIEAHGGTVEKFIGDAVMAVFGAPELHEDDALRAVRAAVEAREAVAALAEIAEAEWEVRLAVRVAVDTGEVVVVSRPDRDLNVTGAAVSVAAHLQARGQPGDILLGDATYRLLSHAVHAEPCELDEGLHAWRLQELIADAPQLVRRDDAPLLGRESELRRLVSVFQATCEEKRCRVVTVVGEAGIGKTRLARELVASVRDEAQVLVGRCVSYGEGATYLPLADVVRQAAAEPSVGGIAALLAGEEDGDRVAWRIAELTGLAEGPAAPGEAFWAVRRFVESLARERPLLLVVDDAHWAEPTLLDLVEYVGEWAEGPILVLCLARPDLLEARASWGGPTSTGFLLNLDPLPAVTAGELVDAFVDEPLSPDLRQRIATQSGGNPLFAQQLVAVAREAPDEPLDTPPSLEALIGSRLDRLDAAELRTIRHASVVGRRFALDELADLSPNESPDRALAELERRGLIHRTKEDGLYRFHHALVRDVAYRGTPKVERAELHERAGVGLARRDGADELVGYHLERAFRYVTEVARSDDRAQELAAAGGEHLGRAGIRAWKRADVPAAHNLLGRAVELLPASEPKRLELACELGLVLRMRGDLRQADAVLGEAAELAVATGSRRIELRATVERAGVRAAENTANVSETVELASTAIREFEASDDHRSAGRAWVLFGQMRGDFLGDNNALEEAGAKAAEHYRRGGWSPAFCVGQQTSALYYGPRPVDEGIAVCRKLLDEHAEDRGSEASILLNLGGLEAMQGRLEDARATVARARSLSEELGQTFAVQSFCAAMAGAIEVLAGHLDTAATLWREACEACIRFSASAHLASFAAELADVLYALDRLDEAEAWVATSRESAGAEDRDAQVSWRSVASKLAARRGEADLAERLAREAGAVADETDALNQRARAALALAEALRSAGREAEAAEAVERAAKLYDLKGNVVAAGRARELLQRPAAART